MMMSIDGGAALPLEVLAFTSSSNRWLVGSSASPS